MAFNNLKAAGAIVKAVPALPEAIPGINTPPAIEMTSSSFPAKVTDGFLGNMQKSKIFGELLGSGVDGLPGENIVAGLTGGEVSDPSEKKEVPVIIRRVIQEEKFPLDDPDKFIEDTVETGFKIAFRLIGLPA